MILLGELAGATAPVRCRVCLLFADIRDITTGEESSRAEAIADLLKRHFATVVAEFHAQNRTVHKFMDDGIIAFFRAPAERAHPSHAPLTATRGTPEGAEPIRIGIGPHFGEAVIGHSGSAERQEETAIGDTVKTASRLEGLCKAAGCAIVRNQVVLQPTATKDAKSFAEYPNQRAHVDLGL